MISLCRASQLSNRPVRARESDVYLSQPELPELLPPFGAENPLDAVDALPFEEPPNCGLQLSPSKTVPRPVVDQKLLLPRLLV